MTRYTVVWEPSVERAFTAYWVASDPLLRINLTEIANWVDTNLSADPETKGRVRSDLDARICSDTAILLQRSGLSDFRGLARGSHSSRDSVDDSRLVIHLKPIDPPPCAESKSPHGHSPCRRLACGHR